MLKGILGRVYRKALSNQLAIAVGSGCSSPDCAIPALALKIVEEFHVSFKTVVDPLEYFGSWNDFIKRAEDASSREQVVRLIADTVKNAIPSTLHEAIAAVPISNFIDATFDRSLLKALQTAGRKPIVHDWHSQRIGSWKQSNPEKPNLFFSLPPADDPRGFYGVYEPTSLNPQNQIQIENIREMLTEKDLLLIGLSPAEAEFILHLYGLCLSYEKAYVDRSGYSDPKYWAMRGVMIGDTSAEDIVKRLVPNHGTKYSLLDALFPGGRLIDMARGKEYDAFVSYFSGDAEFVTKLEQDLRLREIHVWRDQREIDVGDSMSEKIEQGLKDSYTFIIVLSREALERPWVRQELRAAYAQRLAGNLKILPILHVDCEIPPFLADYRYADFRDPHRYQEQLALLERSIRNAVATAREKK